MPDVICRACGGRFHETTDRYKEGPTTGDMLSLKKIYREMGWTSFPEHSGMSFGSLECPSCGSPYCNEAGSVKVEGATPNSNENNGVDAKPAGNGATDAKILALAAAGKKPSEIAKELNLGHHMNVVNRLITLKGNK